MTTAKHPSEQLADRLGDPYDAVVVSGATAWIWRLNEDGDGVAVVRTAAGEMDNALIQIDQLLDLNRPGRVIRDLVVAFGVSGMRPFHERPDLMAVEEAVMAEPRWCRFVAFASMDRISRSPEAALLFLDFLREAKVELELANGDHSAADTVPLLFTILHKMERQMIGKRIKHGLAARRARLGDGT